MGVQQVREAGERMTERGIQIAVARADMTVCAALRWLAVVIPLALVFMAVLLIAWAHRPDPYLIDYDAPGVDITSEGPDSGVWDDE